MSIAGYAIEKETERFQEKTQSTQKFQKRPSIIPKRGIFRSCLKFSHILKLYFRSLEKQLRKGVLRTVHSSSENSALFFGEHWSLLRRTLEGLKTDEKNKLKGGYLAG